VTISAPVSRNPVPETPVKRPDFTVQRKTSILNQIARIIDYIALNRPPKHELVFIWHVSQPIFVRIVLWNTNRCPPAKMGIKGRILIK